MQTHLALLLCVAPSFAFGSYANIYGICNQYRTAVRFTNTETAGNDCTAKAGGNCNAKKAFIPKCEHAGDYKKHHFRVSSDDGAVGWSIWKCDGCGQIQGGTDYGTKMVMGQEVSKGQWNLVISPTGNVSLYPSADWNDCPTVKPSCSRISKKSGKWAYVQSVSSKQDITFVHGVTRTYTNTKTQEWAKSVTVSVGEGFNAIFVSGSVSISSTTSRSISQSYSSTFAETDETQFHDTFDAGTIWQWSWNITDECGSSTVLGTDVVRTNGRYQPPCCLPGLAKDPTNYAGECVALPGDKVYRLCEQGAISI